MKTTLRALAALGALLMLLTACAPKELTFVGDTPTGVSRADDTVTRALEAFKAIDPFTEMKNTDRLTMTTKTDETTDTATESYYDDGRLVYERYLGYGEDTFAYYPDGATYPCLFCQDDGDKRMMARYTAVIDGVWVQVETDGEMHRSDAYGAQKLTVYTAPEGDQLTTTVYEVDVQAKQARITLARYRKDGGDWYAYTDEDGQPQEEPLWLKLTDPSPANVGGDKALPAELAANENVTLTLTMKDATFYFTEDEESGVVWYIEAPLNVIFTGKSKRDAFRRQHPGGDATDIGEEEYRWTARALLKVQYLTFTPWKQFDDLLLKTFDQPAEYTLQLEEDGSVHSLYPL